MVHGDELSYLTIYQKEYNAEMTWCGNRYIYTIILLKSVCRCSQIAGRNSCSIVSGDVSNCSYQLTAYPVSHEFACQFSLDIFLYAKNTKKYREYRVAHATVYLNEAPTGLSTRKGSVKTCVMVGRTDPSNSDNLTGDGGGRVCARVHVCVHSCMHACMWDVLAIHDNNI